MPTVSEVFERMPSHFRADRAAGTSAVVQYDITGDGGGTWHAIIKDSTCTVQSGPAPQANLTLTVAAQDWIDVTAGKQNPQMLFMSGKLKLEGDMGLAMKLGSMFSM
ncbi:MAG: SCP2 sterol-binding domain-containing protein [Candidatus Rokubacteria bacterium]|nr:SCP2 sterol-binding domain-containing protein [Candidatus Rokubacteria bacterium]